MIEKVDVYLNFNGSAAAAAQLYGEAFGKQVEITKFKDFPTFNEMKGVNPEAIGHAEIAFDNLVLMFSDGPGLPIIPGNNFSLSWATDDEASFHKTWNTFVETDSTVHEEPVQTFYATLYGRLEDPFGISWLFLYHKPGSER